MTESNHKTGSSARGTTRYGVKLCQRLTKLENSKIVGIETWDTRGLLTMSICKKGGCPNQGRHGLFCEVNEGHQG